MTFDSAPVDLTRISVNFSDAHDLQFYLRPLCDPVWVETFARCVAASGEAEATRLIVSEDPPEYVVTWTRAPQDIGLAIQEVDHWVERANESYLGAQQLGDT